MTTGGSAAGTSTAAATAVRIFRQERQVIKTTPGVGDTGKVGGQKINANFEHLEARLATVAALLGVAP